MLSNDLITKLTAENELLQMQLADVNYMISIREDELEILRAKAQHAVKLQSQLEGTFNELGQMQNFISEKQQQLEGAKRREFAMENEIIESITIEQNYHQVKSKFESASAALDDINLQLSQSADIYKQLADANARIAELESTLEISAEEKQLLQYELDKAKRQNLRLQQGFE